MVTIVSHVDYGENFCFFLEHETNFCYIIWHLCLIEFWGTGLLLYPMHEISKAHPLVSYGCCSFFHGMI